MRIPVYDEDSRPRPAGSGQTQEPAADEIDAGALDAVTDDAAEPEEATPAVAERHDAGAGEARAASEDAGAQDAADGGSEEPTGLATGGAGEPEFAGAPSAAALIVQLKQLSADFENFRRRSRDELQRAQQRGQDLFLGELLPVLVDFQAALDHGSAGGEEGLREGLGLILEKLHGRIAALGYERIGTIGQRMDPVRHEALFTVPAQGEQPAGVVVQELSPGFERAGKVIHPAKVAVSRAS